jgi:acyl-ACP thioesterase
MKQQLWKQDYLIASYLVNLRGQAGLYAMLNLIQDVGWMHAMHLQVKLPKNLGWIFTRQKLLMSEWPTWNTTVSIQTWLRKPENDTFLFRDYEIFLGARKIGECTSSFTVMDLSTRKMASQDWSEYSDLWRPDGYLEHKPAKIPLATETVDLAQFEVRNSDIDLNQHVNNTRYAQWVLDSLPIENLRQGIQLHQYEVNFLSETKTGDVVSVQRARDEQSVGPSDLVQFQGVRVKDGKLAFTTQLLVTETKA